MKILIATTDNTYFMWQVLVQINNFKKFGLDTETVYVIASDEPSAQLQAMIESPEIKAEFHVYEDTRINKKYISSIRPHVLEKYYREFPEMEKEPIFYVDPDMIFTQPINFEAMLEDEFWHCSNSASYVGIDYLKARSGELLFAQMCDVVGMNSKLIESIPPAGAQYLMKGVTADFWRKCYSDMEAMYSLLTSQKMVDDKPNTINAWCSDMWVVLWNSATLGVDVKINTELEFSWATDKSKRWDECKIFHNAGRTKGVEGCFSKSDYHNDTPFGKEIVVSGDNCTAKYLEEVKETAINFQNIII